MSLSSSKSGVGAAIGGVVLGWAVGAAAALRLPFRSVVFDNVHAFCWYPLHVPWFAGLIGQTWRVWDATNCRVEV